MSALWQISLAVFLSIPFSCPGLLQVHFKLEARLRNPNITVTMVDFQKMGPDIAIFDLVKYGVNGKTVTCLPLGSNFDNF